MFKFVAAGVLTCCGLICSDASACHGGCACPCSQGAATAAPSMPGMPGMPAQANAGGQYRTYSYQPAVAPTYRRTTKTPPHMNAGRHSAGFKQTDF